MSKVWKQVGLPDGSLIRVYGYEGETGEQLAQRLSDSEECKRAIEVQQMQNVANAERNRYMRDYYQRNKMTMRMKAREKYRRTADASDVINDMKQAIENITDRLTILEKRMDDLDSKIQAGREKMANQHAEVRMEVQPVIQQEKKPPVRISLTHTPLPPASELMRFSSPEDLLADTAPVPAAKELTDSVDDLLKKLMEV